MPQKSLTKPQHETTIDGLTHDFRGISRDTDKTTFIRGALPGETVTFYHTKKHRKYHEGQATNVVSSSPNRITPKCPHYGLCGACNLQHVNTNTQLTLKESALFEQFKQFENLNPKERLEPITGPAWGYRHKARLGARYVFKKERLLIGFREHQGRYLADLNTCKTLHSSVGERLPELAELIRNTSIYEDIPQIEVAVGDTNTALIFRHLKPFTDEDIALLKTYGEAQQLHIYLQPGKPDSITKLTPDTGPDRLSYQLPDFDLEFLFHPTDFTQINPEINRKMVKKAIELLDLKPDESVLDLFCGLGNFTLPLARFAKHVTGVEGSERMVERVLENAKHNNITNIDAYAADLTRDISDLPFAKAHYDKVLIDPPRSGALEIIGHIAQQKPSKIVYISCNPSTLARDADVLVREHDYELTAAGILDMFPQTHHVESIALFTLK